jgi:hypothetical protein
VKPSDATIGGDIETRCTRCGGPHVVPANVATVGSALVCVVCKDELRTIEDPIFPRPTLQVRNRDPIALRPIIYGEIPPAPIRCVVCGQPLEIPPTLEHEARARGDTLRLAHAECADDPPTPPQSEIEQSEIDRKLASISRIYAEHAAPIEHAATSIRCSIDGAPCCRVDCAELGCALVGDPVHGRLLTAEGVAAMVPLCGRLDGRALILRRVVHHVAGASMHGGAGRVTTDCGVSCEHSTLQGTMFRLRRDGLASTHWPDVSCAKCRGPLYTPELRYERPPSSPPRPDLDCIDDGPPTRAPFRPARLVVPPGLPATFELDGRFEPVASSSAETHHRPMDQTKETTNAAMRATAQALIEDLRTSVETEIGKTLPERARAIVEGIGEPMGLVVAGWLEVEAVALERQAKNRIGFATEDNATCRHLRELARALEDTIENGEG